MGARLLFIIVVLLFAVAVLDVFAGLIKVCLPIFCDFFLFPVFSCHVGDFFHLGSRLR